MKYFVYYTFKKDDPIRAYVGLTNRSVYTGYKGSGIIIKKSIKKYGKNNFSRLDLGEFNNYEEARYWEKFYIRTLKTLVSQGGFNISITGGTNNNGIHSEETKKIIGEKNRISLKGRKLSTETRQKISKNNGMKKLDGRFCKIEIKTCSTCNKSFVSRYSAQKFCSRQCRNGWKWKIPKISIEKILSTINELDKVTIENIAKKLNVSGGGVKNKLKEYQLNIKDLKKSKV